jgi:hypothetical protein
MCTACQAFYPVVRNGSPPPSPLMGPWGETHSLAGEGVKGPNSDDGTDMVLSEENFCFPWYSILRKMKNCDHGLLYGRSLS